MREETGVLLPGPLPTLLPHGAESSTLHVALAQRFASEDAAYQMVATHGPFRDFLLQLPAGAVLLRLSVVEVQSVLFCFESIMDGYFRGRQKKKRKELLAK